MSLINQMLRDLEQRQDPTTATAAAKIHAPTREPERPRRLWPWLLPAMLATIYYGWSEFRNFPPSPSAPTVQPTTTAPVETTPAPIAASIPTITASPAPSAIPQPAATPQPSVIAIAKPSAPPALKPSIKQPANNKPATPSARHTAEPHASRKQQLQGLLQQAQSSSSLLMRKETLKEALQLDPDHLGIREQLLTTLIKSGNGGELEAFLNDSLLRFPHHPAFISSLAQLQIQRKQYAAATATLERISSNDPGYLALLAGSYQQQKRYRDGAEIYRRLSESLPQKAEHWLGLAICSDNLNQKSTAIQAYRQALDKNTLNAEVVDYINQRLSALN